MSPDLPADTASGEPLPPDAHLRAALRHAPDAHAQPGPALRAAIVRAAHEAVRAGAQPAPHAAPGARSALGELWRRFWQAPTPARPVWAAGLAAAVVASLTLTLWWGEPVPPPVRTEPPLPAPAPPATEAAAPQAQSGPATQGQPPAAALGSTSDAPAREAVAPAADAADAAVAAPARKARAESPAVRPSTDARPRAALRATVPPAAPAIDTAAQSRDQAGPADERTAAPPASPPMAATATAPAPPPAAPAVAAAPVPPQGAVPRPGPSLAAAPAPMAAPPAAPMAKAAEATGNAKAETAAMARRQSGAAQAVAADRTVASLPPTLAQRAATGEPWRTLARLSWQSAEAAAATADPGPSAPWQHEPGGMLWRMPGGMLWREPDGRQWFAPIAPAEWPALDAALQSLRRSDVAPAAPASPAPPR